jgi:hypothetical protein
MAGPTTCEACHAACDRLFYVVPDDGRRPVRVCSVCEHASARARGRYYYYPEAPLPQAALPSEPARATAAPFLSLCPRCGSRLTYRDGDGAGCVVCGAHTWERAREVGPGQAEAREALMVGHRVTVGDRDD